MIDAVIVSTARTPIGKAYRGAFNLTHSPTLLGHAIRHAVLRAGIEPDRIEDAVIGSVLNAGTAGNNVARQGVLAAGLPASVGAQTLDRQCASGLMAIATAAKQIMCDGMQVVVAGGQENISAVQTRYFEWTRAEDPNVLAVQPAAYMPMLETAEFVSRKYGITRDAGSVRARFQLRTAAAQKEGRFSNEIVPITTQMLVVDKATGETWRREVTLTQDEGIVPARRSNRLPAAPVVDGGVVTAGNASQLSDGASACVLMNGKTAEQIGATPLGIYRGMTVVGNAPEEMGIGPIYAIPKLLKLHGLTVDDIGLWGSTRHLPARCCTVATSWESIRPDTTSTAAAFRSAIRTG